MLFYLLIAGMVGGVCGATLTYAVLWSREERVRYMERVLERRLERARYQARARGENVAGWKVWEEGRR